MAEEVKAVEAEKKEVEKTKKVDKKSQKPVKPVKPKKKPIFKRLSAWFRGYKAEFKKIVWTPWKTVKQNTAVSVVTILIFAAGIALVDYFFSQTINILNILI